MPVHVGALAGNSLISFKIEVHGQIFGIILKIFIFSKRYFPYTSPILTVYTRQKKTNRHELKKNKGREKGGGGGNPISTVFPFQFSLPLTVWTHWGNFYFNYNMFSSIK